MRAAPECVIVGQPAELTDRRLHQSRLVEPQGSAPETGKPFNVPLSVLIDHVDALTTIDDEGAFISVAAQIGIGVEVVGHIERAYRIWQRLHHQLLDWSLCDHTGEPQ